MNIVLYVLTPMLYSSLALAAWRRIPFRRGQDEGGSLFAAALFANLFNLFDHRASLFVVWGMHGMLLYETIFPHHAMFFGFALALSAMLWLGVGIYWIESFFFPLAGLKRWILPIAAATSLLPIAFHGVQVLPYAARPLFKLHFIVANIAYGLFVLVALHAILMLFIERRLHALPFTTGRCFVTDHSWFSALPPLLTLEKLLFRLISAGFLLLTLALLSGMLFSEQRFHHALKFDHKTVFAGLSWIIFGAVLIGRRLYGWRSRAALRWVLIACAALLLAYIGSRFVFEVLLHHAVI